MKNTDKTSPYMSVIIPAYNEQDFLPRCLKSLQQQTNAPKFEVIVVDNNSSDNTVKIAKQYGAKVVREPKKGVAYARQAGLKAAKGKIIVSTDADSFYRPNWLQNIATFYKQHPKAVGVGGHYYFYKGALWSRIMPPMGAVLVWLLYVVTRKPIYISAANVSFKKSFFTAYDTKYPMGADERGLLNELHKQGRVYFTLRNPVYTSARRVNQGFLHSIFVTIGYYYAYNVWRTKKAGYSEIGAPPDFRTEEDPVRWPLVFGQTLLLLFISILVNLSFTKLQLP